MYLGAILFCVTLLCSWIGSSLSTGVYTISVSVSCIKNSTTAVTYWSISGDVSIANADWIGIYKVGRCGRTIGSVCPSSSDTWTYVSTNSTSGKQIIPAPTTMDTYRAYYFSKGDFTIKAISNSFAVSSLCPAINLTVHPQTAISNETVVVSWTGANTSSVDDWIVFWQIDSSPNTDQNYIPNAWAFTYGGTILNHTHPTASGNVTVHVPTLHGTYTIYYCQNKGYTCLSSTTIRVVNPKICKPFASTTSTIEHVIIVVSENHSFDSIYGRYCKAATRSKPTCNFGPNCCAAAPNNVTGSHPIPLTDHQNLKYDPGHSAACEICEVNNGLMDRYVNGCFCSSPSNFAIANHISAEYYYSWANSYAIADNFFQSAIGASSENDMYWATSKFLFLDNEAVPQDPNLNGARCYQGNFKSYYSTTIADLLNYCNIDWTYYAEGYDQNPTSSQCYPHYYDASDDQFTYFPSLINSSQNSSRNFRDYKSLHSDIKAGTLPSVNYVKGLGIHSEHPEISSLTAGEKISQNIIDAISVSNRYKENTVVFMVPDESGGFYDHVSPPPKSTVDNQPYGPRIPFVAVGYQTKRNYISHIQMEPSSLIRFIEWNWLSGPPGQLGARDAVVHNIGDMFDHKKTGVPIPS